MSDATSEDYFEPAAWESRYAGTDQHWSGAPNAQLVALLTGLRPGTALDVGCGEGGDVLWLAQQGWRLDRAGRCWDLVTTHFLHPPDAGMAEVTRKLATAVARGGHLLVVGHAPSHLPPQLGAALRRALWVAEDLLGVAARGLRAAGGRTAAAHGHPRRAGPRHRGLHLVRPPLALSLVWRQP